MENFVLLEDKGLYVAMFILLKEIFIQLNML